MAKGEFAQFVKAHYEKVKHLPAKERLKALGEMYRGGKPAGAKKSEGKAKKSVMREGHPMGGYLPMEEPSFLKEEPMVGGALTETDYQDVFAEFPLQPYQRRLLRQYAQRENLTKEALRKHAAAFALDTTGLQSTTKSQIGKIVDNLMGEHAGALKKGRKKHMRGGEVEEMPMNLVPPSVPVDRRSTAGLNVPGAIYSGVKVFNPHEQAIEMQRSVEPKVMKQAEGTFRKQGASQPDSHSTDLKTIMKSFGMTMPKGMRNKQPGAKLTKVHLGKIYQHAVATHGEGKGGDLFNDFYQTMKLRGQQRK